MSSLRELARVLGYRGNPVFAMLRFLGDRSAGDGFTVVAGWLAPINLWELVETNWRIALARYDVPYFHMREFAHSVGPFSKLRGLEGTRRHFISDLAEVIGYYGLYGIAGILNHELLEDVNREYRIVEYFEEPYVLCASSCMALAGRRRRDDFPDHDIEYIFERGDKGARRLVDLCVEWNNQTPVFKPGKPSNEPGAEPAIIGLQAADFAAWELKKAASTWGPDHPFWVYRQSLQALSKRGAYDWNEYSRDDLIEGCHDFHIPRRDDPELRA